MNEKELVMAAAESWSEDEVNTDVYTMNRLRPFYITLKKRLKGLFGDNFIEERNKMVKDDPVNYVKFLFNDAGIVGLVIDEGFGKKEMEIPIKYKLLYRVETLIDKGDLFLLSFDKALEVFEETLRRKISEGYAGFKSIIAYRTGLKVSCDEDLARADFASKRAEWFGRVSKGFRDFLLCKTLEIAKELKVPVQIHTGAGDRDIKLELTRPSYLTDLVRKYEGSVVFVHAGYPYHRESAWMSYIFPSVYLDVSQVVPFAPLASFSVLKEVYEVAPINKVMFGSDAFRIPEVAWLAAHLAKEGFNELKDEMERRKLFEVEDLEEMERRFFYSNAARLYNF
ncbi:amidohydrolase family protein [Stygiolobus caldivivus]